MKTDPNPISQLVVGIKSAGEMASGIAWRLFQSNISKIFMMELEHPLLIRRHVSFGDALFKGKKEVEKVMAVKTTGKEKIIQAWSDKSIAVAADPDWKLIHTMKPDILVDAIMSKKNMGTYKNDADLVIGIGPGFIAGADVDVVVESCRGHYLGKTIYEGSAEPNTGIPGNIAGYTIERVLRSPCGGIFQSSMQIGNQVNESEIVGMVGSSAVKAGVSGVVRGLIALGTVVKKGEKIGDIDPRGDAAYCSTISEKARAIGGAVLEAVLRKYNE